MTKLLLILAGLLSALAILIALALPDPPPPLATQLGSAPAAGTGPGAQAAPPAGAWVSTGPNATAATTAWRSVGRALPAGAGLTVLTAAGLTVPVTAALRGYSASTGVAVAPQFGGTAQLIPALRAGQGDLFIAADASHVRIEQARGSVREIFTVARQRPALAVAAGNPRGIAGLDDLRARGLRLGLPNPESAGLGALLRRQLGPAWTVLAASAAVMKPTVPDLFADLRLGAVDAVVIWDANVRQHAWMEAVADPLLAMPGEDVQVAVSASAAHPALAIQLARWLASPEHGAPAWRAAGYEAVPGDPWQDRQHLLIYSGAVNRPAIAAALQAFADREGAILDTVYNGCGILCADMQMAEREAARLPDAYYACDVCFVPPVAHLFPEAVILTEADIGIAVPAGNPRRIRTLADLARPGIRVGLGNAMQSTLGFMTQRMLQTLGLEKAVMRNAAAQLPTGDLIAAQLRLGAIDAGIVYGINVRQMAGAVEFIRIDHAAAKAVQPFAVRRGSAARQAGYRLLALLRSRRDDFTAAGFRWRDDGVVHDSAAFPVDPAMKQRP